MVIMAVGNIANLTPWKPGQSGYRLGRTPTKWLRKLLDASRGNETERERIGRHMIDLAATGEGKEASAAVAAATAIWAYDMGHPEKPLEVAEHLRKVDADKWERGLTILGPALSRLTDDERKAMYEKIQRDPAGYLAEAQRLLADSCPDAEPAPAQLEEQQPAQSTDGDDDEETNR